MPKSCRSFDQWLFLSRLGDDFDTICDSGTPRVVPMDSLAVRVSLRVESTIHHEKEARSPKLKENLGAWSDAS